MIELIGHFHPLLVHLPIGFLVLALILQWITKKEKYKSYKPVIPVILLWGSIAALISCITGYFLSISDKYNRSLVNWHTWMAISVVLVSAVLYTREKNPKVEIPKKLLSIGLLFLLVATSHLGASLTRGSDYLTKPFLRIFRNDSIKNTPSKSFRQIQKH